MGIVKMQPRAALFVPARRRLLAGGAASIALAACGGGGGASGGGGGGGGGAVGRVITKTTNNLSVFAFAGAGQRQTASAGSQIRPGISASSDGVIADMWNYTGGDSWRITLRRASDFATVTGGDFTVTHDAGFPTSAAAISADGTRLAYSVNEVAGGGSNARVDRVYVVEIASTSQSVLEGVSDPVWIGNTGELLVRSGTGLRIFSAALADRGALPVTVQDGFGAASASPDGRYVAYERDSQIRVHDRNGGADWLAASATVSRKSNPVFSPDGRHLGMLGRGSFALSYLQVVTFTPGAGVTVTDANDVKTAGGALIDGENRIAWIA